MRASTQLFIFLVSVLFCSCSLITKNHNQKLVTNTAIQVQDSTIYSQLKCGLYQNASGDVAYLSEAMCSGDGTDMCPVYISDVWNADPSDSMDGGIKEMKYVVDTTTFQFLNLFYWIDKNHVYDFNPMACGGTVELNTDIDLKTFTILQQGYAKDKNHIYYRGEIMEKADYKTFKCLPVQSGAEMAMDKKYFYQAGTRLSKDEVKGFELEDYRAKKKL